MKGYKIRQYIIFGDSRAAILKVFTSLNLYPKLMDNCEQRFQKDKDIIEVGLCLCWDNDANLATEACMLGLWCRGKRSNP